MPYSQKQIADYIRDLKSSDPVISDQNCIDLIVLEFALTVDEAANAYQNYLANR